MQHKPKVQKASAKERNSEQSEHRKCEKKKWEKMALPKLSNRTNQDSIQRLIQTVCINHYIESQMEN